MPLTGVSNTTPTTGTGQSGQSQAKLEEDLNRFLNLLVTQLKNQDPLDPMDSSEFTSQLVQFANVEQQIYQNANLEKMLKLQEASQTSTMVDYIGRTVEVEGKTLPLENGHAEFTYTMPSGARSATITITDENGATVLERDAETDPGKHTFEWDGLKDNGATATDGTYNVLVSGLDHNGEILKINHTVFGRVTGASAEGGYPTLTLAGDIPADLSKLISVKETRQPSTDEGSGGE